MNVNCLLDDAGYYDVIEVIVLSMLASICQLAKLPRDHGLSVFGILVGVGKKGRADIREGISIVSTWLAV